MLPLVNMQAPDHHHHPDKSTMLMMRKVSISILVMALPVLYASVLRVPPAMLLRDTTFWFLFSNSIIVFIAADSGTLFFSSSGSSDHVDDRPFVVSVSGDDCQLLPPVAIVNDHPDAAVAIDGSRADSALLGADVNWPEREETTAMAMWMAPPSSALNAGVDSGAPVRPTMRRRRRSRSHSSRALVVAYSPPAAETEEKSVAVVQETTTKQFRRTATEPRPPPREPEKEEEYYARLSDEELNRRVEDFIARFNREIRLQVEREDQQTLLQQAAA